MKRGYAKGKPEEQQGEEEGLVLRQRLRAMLEAETQRGPDFLRLANALSALYPKESEESAFLMLCCWR
jgi:hypothetical protein